MLRWILISVLLLSGPLGCWSKAPARALLLAGSDLSRGTDHWERWIVCTFGHLTRSAAVDLMEVQLQSGAQPGQVEIHRQESLQRPFFLLPIRVAGGTPVGLHRSVQTVQADLQPVDFASRGTHEWYVVGRPILAGAGPLELAATTRLERWDLLPAEGEPFGERPVARGAASVAHQPAELHVLGGQYRVPGLRAESRVRRSLLGELPILVTDLLVEPDGRFLLLLEGAQGRLFWVPLEGEQLGEAELLLEHPLLEDATHLHVGRHELDRHRRYVVHAAAGSIHFVDPQLNSRLEGPVFFSRADATDLGLDLGAGWFERYDYVPPVRSLRDRMGSWLPWAPR